ncbi:MAG: hypothetical protein MAG795_00957 [Candidatus Woesearchaeota archaeon]|nr:hypothetical protein [Candidatus Woesearchaeota archaeon]
MLKEPKSMKELRYHTFRDIGDGEARVWVFKRTCSECKKALMSKPRNKKGKTKVRSKIYVCPECEHSIPKKEYEADLVANVKYTCPECKHKGEIQVPFKRKKIKGIKTLRIKCEKCDSNIDITKKLKQPKKKKK